MFDNVGRALTKLTDSVQSALQRFEKGDYDDALFQLESAEFEVVNALDTSEDNDESSLHALLWLYLMRGAILVDLGRFLQAETIYDEVRRRASDLDECRSMTASTSCFAHEYFRATKSFAEIRAFRGQFADAVLQLVSLGSDNSWFECVGFPILSRDIRERINEYGNLLGYESLSKRLLGDVEQLDEGGATKRQEWPSPIPLGGEVLSGFQRRYNRLRNTIFDDTKSDLPLKYERLQKALAIADDWHASLPSSIEARLIRIQILFLREELAIQLDLVHDLEEELMIIDAEIGKFFRDAPEYVDSHRDISWHLYSLGRTILAQHFDDDAKRPRMFWAAAKCLSGSFEILNGDRHRASVTQAVALNMCSISHLIALSNDMLKQTELAAWHRSRRDSILRHVLLLDPNNDRAVSLAKLYEVNPLRSGSLSAEIEEEVSSWRWSIIPLVPSV